MFTDSTDHDGHHDKPADSDTNLPCRRHSGSFLQSRLQKEDMEERRPAANAKDRFLPPLAVSRSVLDRSSSSAPSRSSSLNSTALSRLSAHQQPQSQINQNAFYSASRGHKEKKKFLPPFLSHTKKVRLKHGQQKAYVAYEPQWSQGLPFNPYVFMYPPFYPVYHIDQNAHQTEPKMSSLLKQNPFVNHHHGHHTFQPNPVPPPFMMAQMWPGVLGMPFAAQGYPSIQDQGISSDKQIVPVSRAKRIIDMTERENRDEMLMALDSWGVGETLVQRLLNDWLEADIIPEILMEVHHEMIAQHNEKSLAVTHAALLVHDDVFEDCIRHATRELLHECITDIIDRHITIVHGRQSPHLLVRDDLIDEILEEELPAFVDETISSLAQEHLITMRSRALLDELTDQIVIADAAELLGSINSERLVWEVCRGVVLEEVFEAAQEALHEELEDQQMREVDQVVDFLCLWAADKLCIEHLLQHIAAGEASFTLPNQLQQWLDGLLLQALIAHHVQTAEGENPLRFQPAQHRGKEEDTVNELMYSVLSALPPSHADHTSSPS